MTDDQWIKLYQIEAIIIIFKYTTLNQTIDFLMVALSKNLAKYYFGTSQMLVYFYFVS